MPRHPGFTGLFLASISSSLLVTLHAGQAPVDHEVEGALEPPRRVTGTATPAQTPTLSKARLDQMLAPIALYPDSVLSQILVASSHPLDVVEADRWRQTNRHFDAENALAAAESRDWHPSVKALLPFPDLLSRMSADLQWTRDLGEAFVLAESDVMDRIQHLRHDAWETGHLRSDADTRVARRTDAIYVEPMVREVVRLPQYEPRRVYSSKSWSSYPPVSWHSTHTTIRRDPIIRHDTSRVFSKSGYRSGITHRRSRQSHTSIHIHNDISLPYRATSRYGGSRRIRKATDNRPAWNPNNHSNRDQRNHQHRREAHSQRHQRATAQRSERRGHRERNRQEQESRRHGRQGNESRNHSTRRFGKGSSHREGRISQRRIP